MRGAAKLGRQEKACALSMCFYFIIKFRFFKRKSKISDNFMITVKQFSLCMCDSTRQEIKMDTISRILYASAFPAFYAQAKVLAHGLFYRKENALLQAALIIRAGCPPAQGRA